MPNIAFKNAPFVRWDGAKARRPLPQSLAFMTATLKNCAVIVTIAAVIGIPVTVLVLHYSFWLSHGAGGIGFIIMMITVPGLMVGPFLGMAGIVVVQIVYYVFIAMVLKALFLRYFFEQTKDSS